MNKMWLVFAEGLQGSGEVPMWAYQTVYARDAGEAWRIFAKTHDIASNMRWQKIVVCEAKKSRTAENTERR